ncbi:sugar kinase [Lentilactobacillus kefiri]|uniref:sugar kinase n=1 Tax=Lentilactobacillus kefiri TaxID=33962 RepID=UPI000BA742B0|nr:sugar kinase [Lentilactobacillus kefiri]MCJ2162536.1 sugar kinase [Lentilactobacillus kefiri]MCP9369744.1 sugar kinase [Lentilactobacillus kefiri]MDM7493909.1 sugar kinase [Lentilactobacillus kefiri]PAK58778.1 2-dehydro-3-deoxygluconokinase [Lentilactobacillus kefiri]PAK81539.1 2-dehydro-3-deoxygluconokinase [Lentilactobacillus kefiri]
MQVTTFGEIMLRLTIPGSKKLIQTDLFNANYGGAEANVAVSLGLLGDQVSYITRLPKNDLGISAVQKLRGFGVNTNQIVYGGSRLGIYFFQPGSGIRPSNVIYDRDHSAFISSQPTDYDWPTLLKSTDYFYISGITPALSSELQSILLSAVTYCRQHQIHVLYDANFRGKLWSASEATTFNRRLLPFVDICLVHDEDMENAFGINAFSVHDKQAIDQKESFKSAMKKLAESYPNIQLIASVLRNIKSVQKSSWMAVMLTHDSFYESGKYKVDVVPEVAAGDAFGAGIVHGILNEFNPQFQVDYALAAAILKLTIPGDFNLSTDEEIKAAMVSPNNGINR